MLRVCDDKVIQTVQAI